MATDASLVCGSEIVLWRVFEALVHYGFREGTLLDKVTPNNKYTAITDHYDVMIHASNISIARNPPSHVTAWDKYPYDLFYTLSVFRNCKATDPRDKVLALVGVLADANRVLYGSQSYELTVEDLFTGVARMTSQSCQVLEILHTAGRSAQAPGLLSWVSDWSRPVLAKPLGEVSKWWWWKATMSPFGFSGAEVVPYTASASSSCRFGWSDDE